MNSDDFLNINRVNEGEIHKVGGHRWPQYTLETYSLFQTVKKTLLIVSEILRGKKFKSIQPLKSHRWKWALCLFGVCTVKHWLVGLRRFNVFDNVKKNLFAWGHKTLHGLTRQLVKESALMAIGDINFPSIKYLLRWPCQTTSHPSRGKRCYRPRYYPRQLPNF